MSASTEKGDFKRYLHEYCAERGLTEEIAMTHRVVQDVKEYYELAEYEDVE